MTYLISLMGGGVCSFNVMTHVISLMGVCSVNVMTYLISLMGGGSVALTL